MTPDPDARLANQLLRYFCCNRACPGARGCENGRKRGSEGGRVRGDAERVEVESAQRAGRGRGKGAQASASGKSLVTRRSVHSAQRRANRELNQTTDDGHRTTLNHVQAAC